jgi:L-threonylcarbamoyladenylate synthase
METEKLEITEENIRHAGEIIRRGGLVAFPTETVYGLGANALDEEAVKKVYEAKGRPSDNPMIVHIADASQLDGLVEWRSPAAEKIIDALWPGPITLIFRRKDVIPLRTTGGLDTVGIRNPSNETARRLIRAAERPIAAPSANLSGKPSPTTYGDVLEDMDGRIDAVLLGEDCAVGIESTVLDLTGSVPTILRPGYVTKEMLETLLGSEVRYDKALLMKPTDEDFHPKAPGMKYKHYAPDADVKIVAGGEKEVRKELEKLRREAEAKGLRTAVLDYGRDSRAAAKDFFARLRELDREGVDLILVSALDEDGLGFSVMNRMLKSAGYDVIRV